MHFVQMHRFMQKYSYLMTLFNELLGEEIAVFSERCNNTHRSNLPLVSVRRTEFKKKNKKNSLRSTRVRRTVTISLNTSVRHNAF